MLAGLAQDHNPEFEYSGTPITGGRILINQANYCQLSRLPVIKAASYRNCQLSSQFFASYRGCQLLRLPVIKAASYRGCLLSRLPVMEAASYRGFQLSRLLVIKAASYQGC